MPRVFYTERDIEDLARRGVTEIDVNDDVYITDVARERMEALGIKPKGTGSRPPSPPSAAPSSGAASSTPQKLSDAEKQQVIDRVKQGVVARLGPSVDSAMIDRVVRQVVARLF